MLLGSKGKFWFVVAVVLLSIKLWALRIVPDKVYDVLEFAALGALMVIVFANLDKLRGNSSILFKTNVNLLLILPLISAVAALVFHGQSLSLSMMILRTNFFWLLYFVLHIYEIDAKKIIILMAGIGLIWALITTIQQFTFPHYIFYVRSEEDPYEFFRAGIFRYMIYQHQYCLVAVLYFYCRFINDKKLYNLFFVLIGLIGFYYYGTRQVALAAIICLVILSFTQEGSSKALPVFIIFLALGLLFFKRDVLFKDYIEMTNDQLQNSDSDVRNFSAAYYLFEYWPHWITVLTGNGMENSKSLYGQEMLYLNKIKSMYRSDVGPIGTLNTFGLIYLINIIALNIKGLRNKYFSEDTRYYKLFFLNALFIFLITDSYSIPSGAVPFFCLTFYLVDISYAEKQLKESYEEEAHIHSSLVTG